MTKKTVGESFSLSLIPGIEEVWVRVFGGGVVSVLIFRGNFRLTVSKYFIGEHFGVSEKFFYRKFSSIGWGHHSFVEFFVPQDRNE